MLLPDVCGGGMDRAGLECCFGGLAVNRSWSQDCQARIRTSCAAQEADGNALYSWKVGIRELETVGKPKLLRVEQWGFCGDMPCATSLARLQKSGEQHGSDH